MNIEGMMRFIKRHIVLMGIICFAVFITVSFFFKSSSPRPVIGKTKAGISRNIGISVDEADQQAYMARLEKNYYDFEDRVKNMESSVKSVQSTADVLKKSQQDIAQTILKLDEKLGLRMEQKIEDLKNKTKPT